MKTQITTYTSPGHCANTLLWVCGRLRKWFKKPKITDAIIKSNLEKEMSMSDEEYAEFCRRDIDLNETYSSGDLKLTGREFIEYLVKTRREHISKGGIVGRVGLTITLRKDQLEYRTHD